MVEHPDTGRVAVITGAGGTLCSEMARNLAARGFKVALLGRTLGSLQQVEKQITEAGGIALAVSANVVDINALKQAKVVINEKLGPCSVLINGAGGNQKDAITTINQYDPRELKDDFSEKGFFNIQMDVFRCVVDINTMGTVIPCQVFARDMAEQGGGSIVNIASMNSYKPLSRVAAYGMAKAGVVNFTQWLASYLAPANVRVNAIAPGFFLNEKNRFRLTTHEGGLTDRGANVLEHTPMNAFGEASQLVGTLNWLIDDDAAGFVTGITIPVDGGFQACSGV